MMKKALQLASVASMIDQFTIPNIQLLQSLGYQVDVVADFTHPGTITDERAAELRMRLEEMNVEVHDVAIPRSLNPLVIYTAYKAVRELIKNGHYKIVHCHSPIGGAICRLASKKERKHGTKVLYTAHGFHFYQGAPLANWIIYYPIEKLLSSFTDTLITINKEDYNLAKKRFNAAHIRYIPGIGVDTHKFQRNEDGRKRIRDELNLSEKQTMLLSVGELNENKNHEAVIRAIQGLNLTYVIVGKGELSTKLQRVARECMVDLRLMGYRTDVKDFYSAADIFILPSIREGLNVSLMEAMASGLAIACGKIRGNTDLINYPCFAPSKLTEIRNAVVDVIEHKDALAKRNLTKIKQFDTVVVSKMMRNIYEKCQ